nr:MetaGeneMark_Unknown Function [uncultured bacterium]
MWEVFPSRASNTSSVETLSRSSLKETPFANGWLCFESTDAKRRLAPIPVGWEFATGTLLEQYCQQAAVVPLRRQRSFAAETSPASATT